MASEGLEGVKELAMLKTEVSMERLQGIKFGNLELFMELFLALISLMVKSFSAENRFLILKLVDGSVATGLSGGFLLNVLGLNWLLLRSFLRVINALIFLLTIGVRFVITKLLLLYFSLFDQSVQQLSRFEGVVNCVRKLFVVSELSSVEVFRGNLTPSLIDDGYI